MSKEGGIACDDDAAAGGNKWRLRNTALSLMPQLHIRLHECLYAKTIWNLWSRLRVWNICHDLKTDLSDLKNKETSNFIKCVWTVCNKILNVETKWDKYFVDEVETQLREKPLRGSQTQDIHYSEDKASYKVVALTYPWCSSRTLNSNK